MRSDFQLDSQGWDLVVTDDIALVENAAMTSQDSKFSLQLIRGEVFDDTRLGVPWLTDMVNQQVSIAARKQILRDTIMRTPGAVELTSLDVAVDNQTGIASCTFEGITDNGGIFGSSVGEVDIPSVNGSGIIAEYDYITGKSFGLRLERASEATYIKDGLLKYAGINIPRFEDSGLLLEGVGINYFRYSNEPAQWKSTGSTASALSVSVINDGDTQAPTGMFSLTTDSSVLTLIGHSGTPIQVAVGDVVSASCRVKIPSSCRVRVRFGNSLGYVTGIDYDSVGNRIGTEDKTVKNFVSLGGDGYLTIRSSYVVESANSNFFVSFLVYDVNNVNANIPAGTVFYLQAPQSEINSQYSSFILTQASPKQRSSDMLNIYQPVAKWIYREYIPLGLTSTVKELVEYDGTVSPYGHLQKLKVWNREPTASERAALGL